MTICNVFDEDNLCVVGLYLMGFHRLSSLFPFLLTRFPFVDVLLLVWFPLVDVFLLDWSPLDGFRGTVGPSLTRRCDLRGVGRSTE